MPSNPRVRSSLTRLVLWCALLAAFPAPAIAEWHIVPFIGLTFGQKTSLVFLDPDQPTAIGGPKKKSHAHYGAVVSRLGEGVLGFEGIFTFTPGLFTGTSAVVDSSYSMSAMGNVVITTPRRLTEYGLRPYLSGGLGLLRVVAEGIEPGVKIADSSLAGFNVGGGAIGFFTNRTGVRFEFRWHQAFGREAELGETLEGERVRLRYMTLSVGLVLRRGVS